MNAVSPWGLVMFSAAFDKLVYGEGKYYQPPRAPLHLNVMFYLPVLPLLVIGTPCLHRGHSSGL